MIFLAAAVSDFYVPPDQMPEHKIQSANEGKVGEKDEGSEGGKAQADGGGGLTLHLQPVPKMLGAIKRGGGSGDGGGGDSVEEAWAPHAFVVSFKLETNAAILRAKAAGAIAKYGVDVVCANLLQSYKREVELVVAETAASSAAASSAAPAKRPRVAAAKVRGDEVDEVAVEGVCCTRLSLEQGDATDIEEMLIAELIRLHADEQSRGAGS